MLSVFYNHTFLLTADIAEQLTEGTKEMTKSTLKSLLAIVFSNNMYHALYLVVLGFILVKLVDLFFLPFRKKNTIQRNFIKGILKALIIITFALRIGALSSAFTQFYNTILMSSSLLIVVLGFIFQEGLSNIVHGFLLIISKPFDLGDRVKVTVDGQVISGYVHSITLRNTVIQTVSNNSMVIIPNARMDLSLIDNSYFKNPTSTNFLDLTVTYESDIEKAIEIIGEMVAAHPLVRAARPSEERDRPMNVMVSALLDSSVNLRVSVVTKTIEDNFQACSDLRRDLLIRFKAEPDVEFAYPHMDVTLKK